jgi:hypothetical protein
MAELEALVTGVLDHVNEEINGLQVQLKDLRPSLRALAAHAHWKSLDAAVDPTKVWARRQSVTCFDRSADSVALPRSNDREPIPPLDGKTLRAMHMERVAIVYGIDATKIVSTGSVLSLKKLAAARNDVAHANLPFLTIFARAGFSMKDIRLDLDELEELGFRLVTEFDGYLSSANYLA